MVTPGKVTSAVIIGCGSIGKRHLNNLLRKSSLGKLFVVTQNTQCLDKVEYRDRVIVRDSPEDICADIAIIANETHKHMDSALHMASAGMHLFIEKPLSHNTDDFSKLKALVEMNKLKVFVAYNLRFLKAFRSLREIIASKTIGELYFAQIEVGQYLPSWRPNRDYRETYSANNKMGGGVALDLSHEIDYMRFLFGNPRSWKVIKTHISNLEIDTDDIFEGVYLFPNKFICTIHLDYLQKQKRRILRIVGSQGTVVCDFINKRILVTANNTESMLTDEGLFDVGKTYQDEMDHFINAVETGTEPLITLADSMMIYDLIKDGNV